MPIDCIIFDLGQVIVQVNHEKTLDCLAKMSDVSREVLRNIFKEQDYLLFEQGKLSATEFFMKINHSYLTSIYPIESIEHAWNEMIIGLPSEGIALLKSLKDKFLLLALSNTNCSHLKAINHHLMKTANINDIKALFNKVYYSFELGLGKPDKKIFEHVITDLQLEPSRTLFIDDNLDNIQTSQAMGFKTIHLIEQNHLLNELRKIGILTDEN